MEVELPVYKAIGDFQNGKYIVFRFLYQLINEYFGPNYFMLFISEKK